MLVVEIVVVVVVVVVVEVVRGDLGVLFEEGNGFEVGFSFSELDCGFIDLKENEFVKVVKSVVE